MSGAVTAAVGGAVVGGLISSQGSKSAAKTSARATKDATQMIINETRLAREEILNRMVPALADYGKQIDQLQEYVANGTVDVMGILQNSTANAMQVLSTSGANARQAILGSAASAQGVPRQQFAQQYEQIQSLPADQREQALSQAFPDAYKSVQALGAPTPVTPTTPAASSEMTGTTEEEPNPFQVEMDQMRSDIAATGSPLAGGMGALNIIDMALGRSRDSGLVERTPSTYQPYQDQGTPSIADIAGGTTAADTTVDMQQVSPGQFVAATPAAEGTGFQGAMQQLTAGQQQGLAQLAAGTGAARADIAAGREGALATTYGARDEAMGQIQPYSQAGRSALNQEAALSGALGPEAQQQAINSFIESPGQKYLREQQEKALLRNSAAIGGLGGGNVRSALMEQAMGIASTQQQQYLENLRNLAVRGQSADVTGAGILQQAGTQAAGIQQSAATQLAQLAEALGVRGADLTTMTAQQKAELANQTGLSLAALEQAIGSAQAGALANLGGQQATAFSGGLADVAALGQTGATTQLTGQQNIAQILANLATQQGTQLSNLTLEGGSALAAGQAQSSATMGQTFQDVGNIAAYALANKAASQPITQTYLPGSNPSTDYFGVGMSR